MEQISTVEFFAVGLCHDDNVFFPSEDFDLEQYMTEIYLSYTYL